MVTITLLTLIEESFGVETDAADIEHLTSFEAISGYLRKKAEVCNAN
jgi:acyl carrier protein